MSISVPVMAGKWRFDMSKLLDYAALHDRGIRYSKPHLWRLWTAGKFPKPIKLSASRNAWLESDRLKAASPNAIARQLNP
jgi:hypothetical protein